MTSPRGEAGRFNRPQASRGWCARKKGRKSSAERPGWGKVGRKVLPTDSKSTEFVFSAVRRKGRRLMGPLKNKGPFCLMDERGSYARKR